MVGSYLTGNNRSSTNVFPAPGNIARGIERSFAEEPNGRTMTVPGDMQTFRVGDGRPLAQLSMCRAVGHQSYVDGITQDRARNCSVNGRLEHW